MLKKLLLTLLCSVYVFSVSAATQPALEAASPAAVEIDLKLNQDVCLQKAIACPFKVNQDGVRFTPQRGEWVAAYCTRWERLACFQQCGEKHPDTQCIVGANGSITCICG